MILSSTYRMQATCSVVIITFSALPNEILQAARYRSRSRRNLDEKSPSPVVSRPLHPLPPSHAAVFARLYDLVSQSAQKAAVRAAAGEEVLRSSVTKREMQKLKAQVQALQEWTEASNERVRSLEEQLLAQSQQQTSAIEVPNERVLLSLNGSLVVGAGDHGSRTFALTPDSMKMIRPHHERVVLRWTFDLSDPAVNISFRLVAGANARSGNVLLKDRTVVGGAGGETESAFDVESPVHWYGPTKSHGSVSKQ